ncbi:MAG: glycosyltransferase [Phycisphaerales bacterium]
MHVLLLTDSIFAVRERALLLRLELGLVGEGVRVSVAAPTEVVGRPEFDILGAPVSYRAGSLSITRRMRASRLARDLAGGAASDKGAPVDLVHVFGGAAWGMGVELCRMWEVPLVLELWRLGLVDRARSVAGSMREPPVLIAPDPAIERAALRDARGAVVRLVPWGAQPRPEQHEILNESRAPAIVLVGFGRDEVSSARAFEGIAQVMDVHKDALLFVDSDAATRLGVWKRAARLGIRERVSLIARLEDRRDLVLRADVIVHPDARGEQRSLLLDAMASSMVVVATEDRAVGALVDGQTARLVPSGATPGMWAETLTNVLENREAARALGVSARAFARSKHRVSAHVSGVLDVYEWTVGRKAMAFRAGTG